MRIVKKSLMLIMMLVIIGTRFLINVNAYDLIPIEKVGGGYVTYRNTNIQVLMPSQYIDDGIDFRAVWVSNLVGDVAGYTNKESFIEEMTRVFTIMEHYKINAMIFHIRTHNNALYNSKLNPRAIWWENVNFNEFDPLEWLISESHRRGIEFHAWMNPYRLGSRHVGTIPKINPANNPENILVAKDGRILDPGIPEVRQFLINTVMEVIRNYDVDAIHFDDYFYAAGIDDSATRAKYNFDGLDEHDFRRQQVDIFIHDLYSKMQEYNNNNNRYVQLGISPSGIYQNGSYVPLSNYEYSSDGSLTYPLGSNTAGFSHFNYYLYSDTKNWIDNEWIDYILPQAYWGHEHGVAQFADIMDWWNMVVKNKKVNLYAGMGLYMAASSYNSVGSWSNNLSEAANQVQYASKLENVKGHSIYSFTHLADAYRNKSGIYYQNMNKVREEMWTKAAILPEIRTFNKVTLSAVSDMQLSKTSVGYRIDFAEIVNAKSYVIYRSATPLTYSSNEIIDVVGKIGYNGIASYIDEISTTQNYYYGIKPISKTNTLGAAVSLNTSSASSNGKLLPLDPIANMKIDQRPYLNSSINLRWDSVYPLFGGAVNYEVLKSYDNINYEMVTSLANPVNNKNYYATQRVDLDNENKQVYLKVRAFNKLSEVEQVIKIDVSKNIGVLANFTVIGDLFVDNEVQFKWNAIKDLDDVVYQIQQSIDGEIWTDINNDNPVIVNGTIVTQLYKLPAQPNKLYYRVLASNNEGDTISKSLLINYYYNIGNLTPRVDGEVYIEPVFVNQSKPVEITWDNLQYGNEIVTYNVTMSDDLKNWYSPRTFNSENYLIVGDTITKQIINVDFQYYNLYVKIEAQTTNGRSYFQIIELKREIESLQFLLYMPYYLKTQTTFINSLNIYR